MLNVEEKIKEKAYRMIQTHGHIQAVIICQTYADEYHNNINKLKYYDPKQIDARTKQRNYWLSVQLAIKNWK